jgi:SOS-response transcriptional repressor LexA
MRENTEHKPIIDDEDGPILGGADPTRPVVGVGWDSCGGLIRRERKRAGLTLAALSRRVGCAPSYLSEVERGVKGAPDVFLARVESALGLEPHALVRMAQWARAPAAVKQELSALAGEGAVVRRVREVMKRADLSESERVRELRRLVGEEGVSARAVADLLPREVPVINSVAAGYPRGFTDLGYPARVADSYIRCPDLDDPDAFAARVVGDSMEPVYREGDIVVFSPAAALKSGMDCFARLEPDDECTFKRVFFDRGEDGREWIRLQPLNPAYPPRVLERERVAGLYAAVSVMRRLG